MLISVDIFKNNWIFVTFWVRFNWLRVQRQHLRTAPPIAHKLVYANIVGDFEPHLVEELIIVVLLIIFDIGPLIRVSAAFFQPRTYERSHDILSFAQKWNLRRISHFQRRFNKVKSNDSTRIRLEKS